MHPATDLIETEDVEVEAFQPLSAYLMDAELQPNEGACDESELEENNDVSLGVDDDSTVGIADDADESTGAWEQQESYEIEELSGKDDPVMPESSDCTIAGISTVDDGLSSQQESDNRGPQEPDAEADALSGDDTQQIERALSEQSCNEADTHDLDDQEELMCWDEVEESSEPESGLATNESGTRDELITSVLDDIETQVELPGAADWRTEPSPSDGADTPSEGAEDLESDVLTDADTDDQPHASPVALTTNEDLPVIASIGTQPSPSSRIPKRKRRFRQLFSAIRGKTTHEGQS